MKKILISVIILLAIFSASSVYAVQVTEKNILETDTAGQLIQIKDKEEKEMKDYVELYGTEAYGMTAYILNKVRLYSIPFCFVGIAIGAIYQYVIGIRKLDVRDKGFGLIITFVTILVICQVLPLVFAVVVRGWRG